MIVILLLILFFLIIWLIIGAFFDSKFYGNFNKFNSFTDVKLPYSTVKFLITSHSKNIDYSKNSIIVFTSEGGLNVALSLIDYWRYQRLLKRLAKEDEKREDAQNLKLVLEVLKQENKRLSDLAAKEFEQAEKILKEVTDNES